MKGQSTNVKSTERTKDQFVELAKVRPSVYCLLDMSVFYVPYT